MEHGLTLLLSACLCPLEVEMADHVIDNALAPLEGDDDRIVLVATLELVRAHEDFDLFLVKNLYRIGRAFQPPHRGSVLLLVKEACSQRG